MRRLLLAGLTVVAVALSGFAIENFEITTNDTVVTVRCTGGSQPILTVPFFKEDVSKVIFDAGKYFKYNPTEPSTYEGGTEILQGQFYPLRGDAFGTGPVIVGSTGDGSLMVQNLDLTIPNKIIFPRSNDYAVGFGDTQGSLTVKSLGAEGSQNKTVRFGRTGKGGVGRVTLSLTDPDSDAISQYILSGALQLKLDGGTIKARADAKNPFFTLSTADDPDITVTSQGVTFDNPAGSTLVLGQPLKFASVDDITVLGTYLPTNPGFEEGAVGWTFAQNPSDQGSGVLTSPNHWDGQGANPPDGKNFAMLREGASVSATVDLPDDGLWRVVFKRGGRAGGYSADVTVMVKVDDEVVGTIPKPDVMDFVEFVTPSVSLPQGEHSLAFVAGTATSSHSINIDSVRLERVSVKAVYGTLGKTGAGTLAFDGDDFTHAPIAVNEGTLALKDMTLADNAVTVAGDATLDLSAVTVAAGTTVTVAENGLVIARQSTFGEGSAVTVAEGGKMALSFSPNIVVNGDFEADGKKTYSSSAKPSGWLYSRDEVLTSNTGWGLMGNPDPSLSSTGPLSPNGDCAVYLRESQSFFQTNVVPVAGTYRLSFLAADRNYPAAHSEKVPFYAAVDGEVKLAQGARTTASDFVRYTVDVELSAGAHEIRLGTRKVDNYQGKMVFFDDVSLRKVFANGIAADGEWNMASGSTLDLDLVGELTIKDFFVDGVKVNGRRSAIERAGVTVTGNGSIRVGDKLGMLLIFR